MKSIRRAPQGTAPPTFLVVFCHGYGGDASQLAPLAEAMPYAAFLPDAPVACPFSLRDLRGPSRGRQWFALERPLPAHSPEAEEAAAGLNREVDAELARLSLPEDAVWFVGFSQGAMVSLLAGLARAVAPRGIVGIAGALLAPPGVFKPVCRPPVLLVHGAQDSVVPAERSQDAARRLKDAGIDVRLVLLPGLDHVIVEEAAPHICTFIAERV
jgi:phospholipase/carboxylesterase